MPYANYYLEPFKAAARSFAVEETIAPVRDGSELESVIAAQVSARDGRFVVIRLEFSHRAIRRHGGRNFMLYCNKALPRDSASTFPAFDFGQKSSRVTQVAFCRGQ